MTTTAPGGPPRQFFALLAYSPRSGAATTCVGIVALERDGTSQVLTMPALAADGDGGWAQRLTQAADTGGVNAATLVRWQEAGNGITWDVAELDGADDPGGTLAQALDVLSDEILANPDIDGRLLDRSIAAG